MVDLLFGNSFGHLIKHLPYLRLLCSFLDGNYLHLLQKKTTWRVQTYVRIYSQKYFFL